jgi:5-methylcytosine-specific restriction endonuclease McrA
MTLHSQRKTNSSIWKKIRQRVLQRDGWMCAYCGDQAETIDHVVPVAKGGTDDDWNLVAACKRCNYSKKDSMPVDFLERRSTDRTYHGILSPQNESKSHDQA